MVIRFSQAAARRKREEWLMLAQVVMIGTSAGFSGKVEPIEALARALGLPYPGAGAGAGADDGGLSDLMARLHGPRGG
jgi:hypothetical protein